MPVIRWPSRKCNKEPGYVVILSFGKKEPGYVGHILAQLFDGDRDLVG